MSRVKALKTIPGDRKLDKVQKNVEQALTPLLQSLVLDGVFLQNVQLSSGVNNVAHQLGRRLNGWIIVRKRANAQIWDEQDSNATPTRTLRLQASADAIVDLWVF